MPLHEDSLLAKAADWVWQASLAGAVLVALVLVLQLVFGSKLSPRWRYMLWLLVVARLLMPYTPTSSFSIFNWIGWRSESIAAPSEVEVQGVLVAGETPAKPSLASPPIVTRKAITTEETLPSSPTIRREPVSLSWPEVVALGWLVGAVGYGLFVLVQHGRFASALRHAKPITDARFL
jgi:beta-lactamase regulating signal transducer with metallopeptidase domain